MANFISEDDIEQAILQKLVRDHGYERLNCYTFAPDDLNDGSKRGDKRDVILLDRLQAAGRRLNPTIPEQAIELALAQLTHKRYALSPMAANREVDGLIRDGMVVEYDNQQGKREQARVRVIDFNEAKNNHFLAVSQLWIRGERRYRRPDIILYINGLPLVFIELKNSNVKLKSAYNDNLTNYREDIPSLFHANAFCILSNGLESKVGSFNATWEYFFDWLRVEDERERIDRQKIREAGTSIERIIDGLLSPTILLDFIENFVLYYKESQKIIAQNHQFIGVNKAIAAFAQREDKEGKLGVFWHTQGSGKSFSMIFYVRKIFRKMTGNFSFLIITDRADLDGQIYRNFLNTDTVHKKEAARPKNSQELRAFLTQNKRLIFTLIQKFRYPKNKSYPLLSERDDIIVIVDEAHRTQYETLAQNMRAGLPNAQYIAFTGTPLLGKERKTNKWFGDYVSEYNFRQSMDDGATVPLFYEKRVPEVLIQNDDLSEEFYEILQDENLDDAQQAKLEKKYARQTEIIKRDDRLESIAKDIVYHFPRRGYLGKGIVISLDKFTAVKMYHKVEYHWREAIKKWHQQIKKAASEQEKARLKRRLSFMRSTQMAVVVSEEAGEEQKFAKQGLDIKPHRARMNQVDEHGQDIESQFKRADHPLRLVFVCAMWLTGFDVPSLSTLYLDKPMREHTLMQSIARANRVTSHKINGVPKTNGEIIDYYNVFRHMQQALAHYALGDEGDTPVQDKSALFALLDEAIAQGLSFCQTHGYELSTLLTARNTFQNLEQFKSVADKLLEKDERRKAFVVYENTISALYQACKPEILKKAQSRPLVFVFQYLRGILDSIIQRQDTDKVSLEIAELLDESVVANPGKRIFRESQTEYHIVPSPRIWDLSTLNFEQLKAEFKENVYKHLEIADLRSFIEQKLAAMLQKNITRTDFAQRLQEIIDRYNAGSSSTEKYFEELVEFSKALKEEEARHIREGLTEAELELFDLLKKEKMSQAEKQKVKLAAQALLPRLHENKPKILVQEWHKDAQSQQRVRSAMEDVLDQTLPASYDLPLFKEKCNTVYNFIYERTLRGLPLEMRIN